MHIEGRLSGIQKQAMNFFAEKLFSPQLRRNIVVRVIFRKTLKDAYGFAQVESYNVQGRPRYFIVEVNANLDIEQKLQTLAHEMVHVKQYAYGELNEEMTLWRGKVVDSDKIPYVEHPWEIEANNKGDRLYRGFRNGNVRQHSI